MDGASKSSLSEDLQGMKPAEFVGLIGTTEQLAEKLRRAVL
jgi:hypothetical protein